MKRLLTLFCCFIIVCTEAQTLNNGLIKRMPFYNLGYLVLNKNVNPSITKFRVNVIKRIKNSNGTFTNTKVLDQLLPATKNYLKITPEFLRRNLGNTKYLLRIEALNNTGSVLFQTSIVNILSGSDLIDPYPSECVGCTPNPNGGFLCKWTCNGRDYAYEIWKEDQGNSNHKLSLQLGFDYFDQASQVGIPYYEYVSQSVLSSWCNTPSIYFSWPGITATNCYTVDGLNFIGPLDGNLNIYYDRSNTRIYGNVYGVAKGRGVWEVASPNIYTTNFISGDNCNNPLSMEINRVNTYGNITQQGLPPLSCVPAAIGNQTNPNNPSGFSSDCLGIQPLMFDTTTNVLNPNWFSSWVVDLIDCYNGAGFNGGFQGANVMIHHVSGDDPTPIITTLVDLQNNPLSLENGLYTVGFLFDDGSYKAAMLDIDGNNTLIAKVMQSTITNITSDNANEYAFKIDNRLDQSVNYRLYDVMGVELSNQELTFNKINSYTTKIQVDEKLNHGVLLHHFTFQDGSIKVIRTLNTDK